MTIRELFQKRTLRVLVPAMIGFISYANWAAFVNRHTDHQLTSAAIEGLRTFVFTCIGNLLTETMWSLTINIRISAYRIPLTCLMTWFTMQSIALSIHTAINPSTALATIAPSVIISGIYVSLYVTGLSKIQVQN